MSLAWGIDTNAKEGHGLIGYGWYGWDRPEHFGGYKTATFETREKAKAALPSVRRSFPKARIVRVRVTVSKAVRE